MRSYLVQKVKDGSVVDSPMFVSAVSRKDAIRRAGISVTSKFEPYAVIRVTTLRPGYRLDRSGVRDFNVLFTRSVGDIY